MKQLIEIPDRLKEIISTEEGAKDYGVPLWLAYAIAKGVYIPDNATNGDVIKAMYPNAKLIYHEQSELVDSYVTVSLKDCDVYQDYPWYWWNAPYKGVEND